VEELNKNIDLLVELMDAEDLDASPVITIGEINETNI
jgi:hypothetical protein